jgi:putative Holliday junction resolvase
VVARPVKAIEQASSGGTGACNFVLYPRSAGTPGRGLSRPPGRRAAAVNERSLTLAELKAVLPESGALLGLDLGTRTIGIAVSDVRRMIASPVAVIRRSKLSADLGELRRHLAALKPVAIVLGLPVNMDGSEGPRAQSTRAFARHLADAFPLPVVFWDERLSTAAVTRALLEADASRKRRGEVVDKMAAAYILQGALDRLARM